MSYKKYSPFLKSVKILMLLSFMYFTTRLDAAVDLHIPVTLQKFDYKSLPVYCKSSTKHFECKLDSGEIYCLPESYKCRIKCANDADLKCTYSATTCQTGEYQCNRNINSTSPIVCILNENLCDSRLHCPLQDDEDLEMCKRRSCGPDQFACQSPGHCIAESRKCDGQPDCRRPGFDDQSDEQNCINKHLMMSICTANQFTCKDRHGCVSKSFVCDGFGDCDDRSDEADCGPAKCQLSEFECDGRCMKNSLRCDNKPDCLNGEDEKNCKSKCQFDSEFYCRNNGKCVSQIFLCDGTDDCGSGDDEVCPINNTYCGSAKYWTCKSGNHCIIAEYKCDSKLHCPDGSDELDCPTTVPPPAPVVCPPGHHRCNGTNTCVDVIAACKGLARCPQPDTELDNACLSVHRSSPCDRDNGGCHHLCEVSMDGVTPFAVCACRPGYQTSPSDPSQCVDVDECQQFGSCAQLCSNTVGSFSCSCLPGYRSHGSACLAHGAAKLLFSTDSSIEYMDLETGNRKTVLGGLHYPKYLAYDIAHQQIFYHGRHGVVGSVRLDGEEHRVILQGLLADAIAYDWTRRLLFYSTPKYRSSSGHIGVIDINTGRRTILYLTDCPWGLAVNPRKFALYFSLRCSSPNGVYTMKMDGSGFHLLLNTGGKPGHLAIDLAQRPERLYWMDTLNEGIYSGTVDGGDLRVHLRHKSLFDLALFEDKIYFSNLHHGHTSAELRSANKFLSDPAIEPKLKANSVLSVAVYHSLLQPTGESLPECDCQHICLAPPPGTVTRSCLCDINYRMDPATSLCVNGTEVAADGAGFWPSSPTAPSQGAAANSPLEGRVGSIAGIVIGALCVCLILGVTVAMYCLRVQDRQSISLNVSHEPHCKEVGSMPKVNSRTPLTDCEIDMDNSKF